MAQIVTHYSYPMICCGVQHAADVKHTNVRRNVNCKPCREWIAADLKQFPMAASNPEDDWKMYIDRVPEWMR